MGQIWLAEGGQVEWVDLWILYPPRGRDYGQTCDEVSVVGDRKRTRGVAGGVGRPTQDTWGVISVLGVV